MKQNYATTQLPRIRPAELVPAEILIQVLTGPDLRPPARITKPVITIGGAKGTDFCIQDGTVSSFHVELRGNTQYIQARDFRSSNGVCVVTDNGEELWVQSAWIPSGSRLRLGNTVIRVSTGAALDQPDTSATSFGELIGQSPMMRQLFAQLKRVASGSSDVLIEGPTGTGKELVAREIHRCSRRSSGPYVVLDCSTLNPNLAESVLFGHVKGAYTSSVADRKGLFELANHGVIFIDEIGELSLNMQTKFLRVLQDRHVTPVGGNQPVKVDVRVISASWRDLRQLVNEGKFRQDLYYRLAPPIPLRIPSLMERPEDIPLLAAHFVAQYNQEFDKQCTLSAEVYELLQHRDYPGNVRELEHLIRYLVDISDGTITRQDLQDLLADQKRTSAIPSPSTEKEKEQEKETDGEWLPLSKAKERFYHSYLVSLLRHSGNNISKATRLAGFAKSRARLRRLLEKYGVAVPGRSPPDDEDQGP